MYEEHYVEKIDQFLSLGIKIGEYLFFKIYEWKSLLQNHGIFRLDVRSTKLFDFKRINLV